MAVCNRAGVKSDVQGQETAISMCRRNAADESGGNGQQSNDFGARLHPIFIGAADRKLKYAALGRGGRFLKRICVQL